MQKGKFRSREWKGIFLLFCCCGCNNWTLVLANWHVSRGTIVTGSTPQCHTGQDKRGTLYENYLFSIGEITGHRLETWFLIYTMRPIFLCCKGKKSHFSLNTVQSIPQIVNNILGNLCKYHLLGCSLNVKVRNHFRKQWSHVILTSFI